MKAIILAAGYGNRLLPYTNELPKCLLVVGDRPIIEHQLIALRECGINELVVVVGHCGDKLRKFLSTMNVSIVENSEFGSTNSGYSLWYARDYLRKGFIYINSDLLFNHALLAELLRASPEDGIIVDRKVTPSDDMFKAELDKLRIVSMDKRIESVRDSVTVVGPAKFSAQGAEKVLDHLEQSVARGHRREWCYKIFSDVAAEYPFYAIVNPGFFWAEIDSPSDLEYAQANIPADFSTPGRGNSGLA